MPVYRGGGKAFDEFRSVPTTGAGHAAPGVSVALDLAVANEFAEMTQAKDAGQAPQVYPLFHRAANSTAIDLAGDEAHHEVVATLQDAFDRRHDAVMLRNYTTPG